jgi:predicted nucleic acid-binding protein
LIIVDSSVWIDYFNGVQSPQTDQLDGLLGRRPVGIGDLILAEVLQGFRRDADFTAALRQLARLPVANMLGRHIAIRSAENFRTLRQRGLTVRKTADCIIATFCIENGHSLLFADKDFRPFVAHLGLVPTIA